MHALVVALWLFAADRSARDAQLMAEIERSAPAAAEAFKDGNDANERGDWQAALTAYEKALAVAPSAAPVLRGLCFSLSQLQRHDDGIARCREALRIDPSAESKVILANVLMKTRQPAALNEARSLLAQALARDEWPWADRKQQARLLECEAWFAEHEATHFARCASTLATDYPSSAEALFYAHIAALSTNESSRARDLLERAKAQGLPQELYAQSLEHVEAAEPLTTRYGKKAMWAFGACAAACSLLLLARSGASSRRGARRS
jgi:tetratricopeptide (TPR) repeat protein